MTYTFDWLMAVGGYAFASTLRDSGLIAVALLISWGLRGRLHPALMSGLWVLVILRLLIPWSAPVAVFDSPPMAPTAPAAAVPAEVSPPLAQDVAAAAPKIDAASQSLVARRLNWLLLTWLVGFLSVVCLRLAVQLRFAARVRRAATLALGPREEIVQELCRSMGLWRMPRFAESDAIDSPCVCGAIRPVVLFPRGMYSTLDDAAFRHVAAHELAHIKRGDVLLLWAGALASCVHWFNPLVWLAVARQRADAELAADAKAVRHLAAEDSPAYGDTLLAMASRGNMLGLAGMPVIVGSGSHVAERVRAIAAGRTFGWGSIAASATALGMIATAAFCEPVAKEPKTTDEKRVQLSAAGEAWREKLSKPISIEFEDVALKEILDFVSQYYELPLKYSPEAAQGLALHMPLVNLRQATAGSALDLLARECGLVCVPAKDALWIGAAGETPEPSLGVLDEPILAQSFGMPGAREKLLQILNANVSVEFQEIYIGEVLAFLSDTYQINFVADPRAVPSKAPTKSRPGVGGNPTIAYISQKNVKLRDLLAVLLPQEDPLSAPEVELFRVGTTVKTGTPYAVIKTPKSVKTYPVGDSFEQYTLKQVDVAGKSVVLFDDLLKKELVVKLDDSGDPNPNVVRSNISGLDFSVEEDYVWISTPELLRKESRWYGK